MSVYPRWRGEHDTITILWLRLFGLSPLARGTHRITAAFVQQFRFIPAGAGNTGGTGRCGLIYPVYPRWRGEHEKMTNERLSQRGLSPLARGTRKRRSPRLKSWRFIPAGAGNTPSIFIQLYADPVYPRWRGEHSKTILLFQKDFFNTKQPTNL